MLIIRSEQMQAMTQVWSDRLEQTLKDHVQEFFPLSAQEAAVLIPAARAKAASYDLYNERDLHRFVNVCAEEGIDFDLKPENAWMRTMLLDPAVSSPSQRLELLTSTREHQARVQADNASLAAPQWLR
ncbi:hypothetical protein [Pseudomonas sp. efr-133-TYG-5]|jgi:hypothetical protein|uniref:hypothetical protein n=1 Tax=Pseudomonas sp. efr-133-TYG-5 TaxID=3040310 RepID=UPI002552A1E1|nr:hypothetical protein [Pseudomonas sp. efr-133-TYG-5]